jgi:manganese transport protein
LYYVLLLVDLDVLCEVAIMATDLAEVIGSAIALNLLFKIPMVWGVLITGFDVLVLMMFGFDAKHMRYFEFGIAGLVFATAGCLFVVAAESDPSWGAVALGFLPSIEIVTNPNQLYVAVGIIGATVMPHNLYLHSSIVKYRAQHDDGAISEIDIDGVSLLSDTQTLQRKIILPTVIKMATIDAVFALTFALFVNASILIVASANFNAIGRTDVAEIEDAFHLIGDFLGMGFAYTFAVGLLFAGQSSTITGTMAGQIVMEGFLGSSFNIQPWARRLVTRLFAMVPALVCISIYGERGLNNLLIISQIILSLQLPFAVWPLIWFSSRRDIMEITFADEHDNLISPYVPTANAGLLNSSLPELSKVDYTNSKLITILACTVGVLLTVFNGILLVHFATGAA